MFVCVCVVDRRLELFLIKEERAEDKTDSCASRELAVRFHNGGSLLVEIP